MDCSTPGFSVLHQLLELAQTHVHWVSDAIQPTHRLSSKASILLLVSSFFALFTEEGFLISPCYSLELCIQMGISFLFSFAFHVSSFLCYLLGLLGQPFCYFGFLFLGGWS